MTKYSQRFYQLSIAARDRGSMVEVSTGEIETILPALRLGIQMLISKCAPSDVAAVGKLGVETLVADFVEMSKDGDDAVVMIASLASIHDRLKGLTKTQEE